LCGATTVGVTVAQVAREQHWPHSWMQWDGVRTVQLEDVRKSTVHSWSTNSCSTRWDARVWRTSMMYILALLVVVGVLCTKRAFMLLQNAFSNMLADMIAEY